MKLFLSSYRFGDHTDTFVDLMGRHARIAVVAAAADSWPENARNSAVIGDVIPLRALGFRAEEVDIREFSSAPDALEDHLRRFDCLWVRGGNTFVLRAQLARGGADRVITNLVRSGVLAYAGYSAGACVVTPTLIGLDASDDPAEVLPTCGIDPVWSGLGLVDFAIIPHGGDSILQDPEVTERTASALTAAEVPFVVLDDRQAVVVDGGEPSIV